MNTVFVLYVLMTSFQYENAQKVAGAAVHTQEHSSEAACKAAGDYLMGRHPRNRMQVVVFCAKK